MVLQGQKVELKGTGAICTIIFCGIGFGTFVPRIDFAIREFVRRFGYERRKAIRWHGLRNRLAYSGIRNVS